MESLIGEPITAALRAPIPLDTDLDVVAIPATERALEWHLIEPDTPNTPIVVAHPWEPDCVDTEPVGIADAALAGGGFPY